jgi:hypothetical protein
MLARCRMSRSCGSFSVAPWCAYGSTAKPRDLELGREAQRAEMTRYPRGALPVSARELTCCFLRPSNVDSGAFERLGRHNATLWKQTAQRLFLLHASAGIEPNPDYAGGMSLM